MTQDDFMDKIRKVIGANQKSVDMPLYFEKLVEHQGMSPLDMIVKLYKSVSYVGVSEDAGDDYSSKFIRGNLESLKRNAEINAVAVALEQKTQAAVDKFYDDGDEYDVIEALEDDRHIKLIKGFGNSEITADYVDLIDRAKDSKLKIICADPDYHPEISEAEDYDLLETDRYFADSVTSNPGKILFYVSRGRQSSIKRFIDETNTAIVGQLREGRCLFKTDKMIEKLLNGKYDSIAFPMNQGLNEVLVKILDEMYGMKGIAELNDNVTGFDALIYFSRNA